MVLGGERMVSEPEPIKPLIVKVHNFPPVETKTVKVEEPKEEDEDVADAEGEVEEVVNEIEVDETSVKNEMVSAKSPPKVFLTFYLIN